MLLSSADEASKRMQTAAPNTRFVDITEHITEPVTTDDDGWGEFRCAAGSVSVWVPEG